MGAEIEKVMELTGAGRSEIRLADDGFCSRGYVIDGGRIVFKFKKTPETSYRAEVKMLNFINSLGLGVALQKVGWVAPDDEYLGVYGVVGKSLEATDYDSESVGEQLGEFLKKLHAADLADAKVLSLNAEIEAWQQRFDKPESRQAMREFFSEPEMEKLNCYMHEEVPAELRSLGEKLVLSHGDLGDGNIFVNGDGKVGVIDFNETCYLDQAADFMDVSSNELCEEMLETYGADETLRRKTEIRRELRPLIVFGNYAKRGDEKRLGELTEKIRRDLL